MYKQTRLDAEFSSGVYYKKKARIVMKKSKNE